ncbi:unnamed protein product [Hermetia illucens]|uniref:Homeobox domain-containing protein n=1 Tax=Hermetia illucens TaxID=343691 RepID=A0A7R8YYA8_HERIL|nr:unnamed protein product [Hermetia illucens]
MASSRLRFLEEETLILEDKYQDNPRPTSAECKILAERFNVTSEKIRVWFKNRRAKALKKPDNNKRSRTYINSRLASILEETYMNVPIPDRQVREELAAKTGLSTVQVKVWFQNRRAKGKKDSTYDQRRNIEVDKLEDSSDSDKGSGKQIEISSIEDRRTCSEPYNVPQIQANGKVIGHVSSNTTASVSPQQEALGGSQDQQSTVPATHNAFQHTPSYYGPPIHISPMQNNGNPHTNYVPGPQGSNGQYHATHGTFQHTPFYYGPPIHIGTMPNYGNPTVPSHTNYVPGPEGYNRQYQCADAAWQGGYYNYSHVPQLVHYNAPTVGVHSNPANAAHISGANNYNFYYNSQSHQHYASSTQSSENGTAMAQHFNSQQSCNYGMGLVQNINGNEIYNLPGQYPMSVRQNDGSMLQNTETTEPHSLTNVTGAETESLPPFTNNPTLEDLGDLHDVLDQVEVENQPHQMENVDGSRLLSNGLDMPHDTGMIQSEHNINPLAQDDPVTLQVQVDERVAQPQNESTSCQFEEEFPQEETNDVQIDPDIRNTPQDKCENRNGSGILSSGLDMLREIMDGYMMPSEHNVKNVTQDDPGVPQHPLDERGTNGDESVSFQLLENSNANLTGNIQVEPYDDPPHFDINKTSPDRYDNGNPIPTLSEDEIYIRTLLDDSTIEMSDNTSSTNHREPDSNVIPVLKNVNLSADLLGDGVNFVFDLPQPEVGITNTIREIDNEDDDDIRLFLDELIKFK